jgi:hypothetical protein
MPLPTNFSQKIILQGIFKIPHTPVLPALAVPGPSFSHGISTSSEVPVPAPVEDRDKEILDTPPPDSDSEPNSEPKSKPSIIEDPFLRFFPPEPEPSDSESDDSDSEDNMPKPIEWKICIPPDFNSDRDETTKFLRLITLYLNVNAEIYNTDTWKIAFALSFMKEGTATASMEDTIAHAHERDSTSTLGLPNGYGTWEQFVTHFEEAFNPIDLAGTALHKLHALKQSSDLSEYITTFKQLCNWAEIYNFNTQKDYFLRGLKPALLSKLCNSR